MQNIASINATHEGKYRCTVLTDARGSHLQGSFCVVPLDNGYFEADVLCRAGIVNTHNQAHETPHFQLLIAKRGQLTHISAIADVEQIILEPLAFYDKKLEQLVGSQGNPPSGTLAHMPEADELNKFRREQHFQFQAGYMPGHPEVVISLVNRDFGPMEDANGRDLGGHGEARHRLYAGKNGSGKTVFAFQAICARASQQKRLGVLMLDTKGDIVVEGKHRKRGFNFDPHGLLRDAGRTFEMIPISQIRLTDPDFMIDHLSKVWGRQLGKKADIVAMVLRHAINGLMETHHNERVDLAQITFVAVREEFVRLVRLGTGWAERGTARTQLADDLDAQLQSALYQRDWNHNVVPIYNGAITSDEIVGAVLHRSAIRMVNLQGVREEHQAAVVVEMLRAIKSQAQQNYYAGRATNAEIFLDEAPRWVPQDRGDNPYAGIIVDAINTTRAYGVGWTFCTQRLTAIDKNILAQCHTRYFCKGLGVGSDAKHMEDDLGSEGLAYYRLLNLENAYFCMVSGEELNFGSGASHIAFVGWAGEVNEQLKHYNQHIWIPQTMEMVTR